MPIFFRPKKPTKSDFSTKKHSGKTKKYQESCQEIQDNPRILPRNLGKPKNKRKKAGGVKIPGYNLAHRQETRTTKKPIVSTLKNQQNKTLGLTDNPDV